MICNYGKDDAKLSITVDGVPDGRKLQASLLEEAHDLEPIGEYRASGLTITLKTDTVLLLESAIAGPPSCSQIHA